MSVSQVDAAFNFSNSSDYDDNSTAILVDGDSLAEEGQAQYVMDIVIAILAVATVLSVVVIVGLLIPLFIQLKNGTFYQARNSRRSNRQSPYSTYNLYLVYSAFVDLIFPVSFIIDSKRPVEAALHANLWINAVIVYEVLVLLRASKSARRIEQPSLMKVNLQAGAIFAGMILLQVLPIAIPSYIVTVSIWYCLYFIPILFVIGVTIYVKWKDYLPPSSGTTPRDKAVRGLALFFFRVILVFLVIWIPMVAITMVAVFSNLDGSSRHWYDCTTNSASMFLIGCQPILNFYLILSKPDVKKYITDLVMLTYIFGDSNCCWSKNSSLKTENGIPSASTIPGHAQRPSTTLLGYTVSDVEVESAGEADENKNSPTTANSSDGNNEDMETGTSH